MKTIVRYITKAIESTSSAFAIAAMWGIFAMMVLVGYDVFSRYLFNRPVLFSDEVSGYLLVFVCFLGAAGTLKESRHITVDVLFTRLNLKWQMRLKLVTLILCIGFLAIFCWHSYVMAYLSLKRGVRVPSILLTPIWIPQSLVFIGAILLILQLIVETGKHIGIMGRKEIVEGGDQK